MHNSAMAIYVSACRHYSKNLPRTLTSQLDICSLYKPKLHKVLINRAPQWMFPRRNRDSPHPSPPSECALPPGPKGGGAHSPAGVGGWGGWGSPYSDDCRKSLALCLFCAGLWRYNLQSLPRSNDGACLLHSLDVAACPCRPGSDVRGLFGVNLTLTAQLVLVCSIVTSQLVLNFPEWSPLTSQFVIDCLESGSLMSQACPGLRNRFLGIDS
jgi:hypothetical protein